jgi:hypothetical protein
MLAKLIIEHRKAKKLRRWFNQFESGWQEIEAKDPPTEYNNRGANNTRRFNNDNNSFNYSGQSTDNNIRRYGSRLLCPEQTRSSWRICTTERRIRQLLERGKLLK